MWMFICVRCRWSDVASVSADWASVRWCNVFGFVSSQWQKQGIPHGVWPSEEQQQQTFRMKASQNGILGHAFHTHTHMLTDWHVSLSPQISPSWFALPPAWWFRSCWFPAPCRPSPSRPGCYEPAGNTTQLNCCFLIFVAYLFSYWEENAAHINLNVDVKSGTEWVYLWSTRHLIHVENQVEFTHVLEAFVQRLHEHLQTKRVTSSHHHTDRPTSGSVSPSHLDQIQNAQLALRRIHAEHEVQGGVVSVDQLVLRAAD